MTNLDDGNYYLVTIYGENYPIITDPELAQSIHIDQRFGISPRIRKNTLDFIPDPKCSRYLKIVQIFYCLWSIYETIHEIHSILA